MKTLFYILAAVISLTLFYFGIKFRLHPLYSYVLSVNLTTFLLYCIDKFLAIVDIFRIPEKLLQIFTLIGGSLGALFAQHICRHKTIKKEFQKQFWTIIAIQVTLIIIFFSLIIYWA